MMLKKLLIYLLYFGLFFSIILIFTHGLFNNFFEQDEWGAFGDLIYSSNNQPWWNILISRGTHFSPFGFLFWSILYQIFGLQAQYYTFTALVMHSFASFLVFSLASKLSKSTKIGLLTGILFATNGRANQAFTHLAIFSATTSAFIFITLFFIYLTGIKNRYFSKTNVAILFIIFLTAMFFREEGIIVAPLFFTYLLVFDKDKINMKNVRPFIFSTIGLFVFLFLRFISGILNTIPIPTNSVISYKPEIYNILTIPVKFVIQNLFIAGNIFNFLMQNYSLFYPDINASFLDAYPVFMDVAVFFLFTLILLIFGIWIYASKKKNLVPYILFCSCWIFSNSLILSFVGRKLYILEDRYLYFSSFPVLFLLSIFLSSVFKSSNAWNVINIIKKIGVSLIIVFLIFSSYQDIQAAVKYKTFNGNARRKLLKSIITVHPYIPNNTIFYIKCKGKCHRNEQFGLSSEWVLPFSSGPGWNLLVLYSSRGYEKIWSKFLTNIFLLDLNSQGYKKIGNDGFGYFINKNLLKKTLIDNNLNSEVVIALEYNEDNFTVSDISKTFRKELSED